MPDILVRYYSRYGAIHVAGQNSDRPLTADEKELCQALGERLARVALQLQTKG